MARRPATLALVPAFAQAGEEETLRRWTEATALLLAARDRIEARKLSTGPVDNLGLGVDNSVSVKETCTPRPKVGVL